MVSFDKDIIHMYLQHGMGQLILDTSILIIGEKVVTVDPFVVSVKVRDILIGDDEDLIDDRITISTMVDNPAGKQIYGIDLNEVSPDESFILFLRGEGTNFSLASVSNPQSILMGCFRVETEENLAVFIQAMQLLDKYLMPEDGSLTEDFPAEPSLPGCQGCLFLMRRDGPEEDSPAIYRCGRVWTRPACEVGSLRSFWSNLG